jgi:hypothetical protein
VLAASIIRSMSALMMEAASTSETLVNFYQTTRRNNLVDSYLHTLPCCKHFVFGKVEIKVIAQRRKEIVVM